MIRSLIALFTLAVLSGCAATSAKVVGASGGPTVAQAQAAPYDGPRQRIAVSSFEFRHGSIGEGMSDMLVNALFNADRFIVLERARLNDVTAEQDLAAGRRFKQDTAAPIGQLEGAQLLIRGSVTQFEPDCKGASVIVASTRQACIAINLRIVDAATGRVVNATTVEGTSVNRGVGFTFARSDLPIGLGAYSNTPMEQAIRNCIETAVQHIANTKF